MSETPQPEASGQALVERLQTWVRQTMTHLDGLYSGRIDLAEGRRLAALSAPRPAPGPRVGFCLGTPARPHANIEWSHHYTVCTLCHQRLRYEPVEQVERITGKTRPEWFKAEAAWMDGGASERISTASPAPASPPLDASVLDGLPMVGGDRCERTFADFERACRVHLRDEQEKPNPDNVLIALLCDAVRVKREAVANARQPLQPASPPPPDLVRLVLDLQAHGNEQGWQDVDDPIARLLEWRSASPPGERPDQGLIQEILAVAQSLGQSVESDPGLWGQHGLVGRAIKLLRRAADALASRPTEAT